MPRQATCDCGDCRKCKQRVYMRRWYQAKPLEVRRAMIAGRNLERVRAADRARHHARKHDPEYRAKRDARGAVNNAIRDGRLVRGDCELADADCRGQVEAHHEDYSRPLDVRWLCKTHHDAITLCLTTS